MKEIASFVFFMDCYCYFLKNFKKNIEREYLVYLVVAV